MPKGNMFSSSHHHKIASNAVTVQQQGGGEKKAGFPYIIGRTEHINIALKYSGLNNLTFLMKTNGTKTNPSRPIGSVGAAINTQYHIPGI